MLRSTIKQKRPQSLRPDKFPERDEIGIKKPCEGGLVSGNRDYPCRTFPGCVTILADKFYFVNARSVFCFSIFFCLVLTNPCLAGLYQKTKDGKAYIWNNHPMVGAAAELSGDKDADGYATGHGTLTWFTTEKSFVTGSNIPAAKRIASDRYTGTM